jgi:dienelactone hydrolase
MVRPSVLVIATAIALLAAWFPPLRAAGRTVSIRTEDGTTLTGSWFEPAGRAGPAVILVHMLHRSRRDWDDLASRLAAEGIGTLTFDLRGHGESTGSVPPEGAYAAFQLDLNAARRFVVTRPDVLPHHLGIAGASLGASLAVLEAAQSPGVSSVALLSAATEYRGLRIDAAMKKYTGRALLVYSDDDPYAQRSARDLIKLQGPSGTTRETLALHHAGHGTNMLSADATLPAALVDWFKRTLL